METKSEIQRYRAETSKEVIINADLALFAQMMIIALPSSPLGHCSADGSLRKPNKASLAKELQKKNMTAAEMIPQPCARIMDGMAMIQKIRGDQKTFAEVAESLMYLVLNEGTDSQRVGVVFDVYRDNSIKNPETEKRGS